MLGDGRVTVVVEDGGRRLTFSRTASEPASAPLAAQSPTFFAQSEIESVALDAAGRLNLLDGFISPRQVAQTASSLVAQIASLSTELRQVSSEVADLDEQLAPLADAPATVAAAETEQKELLANSSATDKQTKELAQLTAAGAAEASRVVAIQRATTVLRQYVTTLSDAAEAHVLEDWPAQAGTDQLKHTRQLVTSATARVFDAVTALQDALREIAALEVRASAGASERSEQERLLRHSLDQLQAGLGAVARRLAEAQKRAAQLATLTDVRARRVERLQTLQVKRVSALDDLDSVREVRYRAREAAARAINSALAPNVRVNVQRSGSRAGYEAAIVTLLRGSGLHYGSLAPQLAERLSPRELADAIERRDSQAIAELADIGQDRAERLVSHVAAAGTGPILTSEIEDSVTLSLLDGGDFKTTEHLSTGQRCTVVLSTLLLRHGNVLVIDQPEDHLDNAYVATTLVSALRERGPQDQMLFTTHNANIPVLGEADAVFVLGSDGHRGYVQASGPLTKPAIVESISSIMEGGREAFRRRAEFYGA